MRKLLHFVKNDRNDEQQGVGKALSSFNLSIEDAIEDVL